MPFLHIHCKTDHYNSNKTVRIKPKEGYVPILTKTGWLYEGHWVNDKRQGFGVFAKRSKCMPFVPKYRGDWYTDKRHGSGNGYYVDGGYYVGKWKNNMRFGYGKMWYSDGSFYAGDWKCDKRWGQGLFVDVTGDRYEGSWYKDEKHGLGRLYHLSTGQMQEGAWLNDAAICTTIEDIPFRQTAVFATEYPIKPLELQRSHQVILNEQRELFKNDLKIYATLETPEISVVMSTTSKTPSTKSNISAKRFKRSRLYV